MTRREKKACKLLVMAIAIAIAVWALFFRQTTPENNLVVRAYAEEAANSDKVNTNGNDTNNDDANQHGEAEMPTKKTVSTVSAVKTEETVVIMSTPVIPQGGEQVAYEMSHNYYVEESSVVPAPSTYVDGGSVNPSGNAGNGLALLDQDEEDEGDTSSDEVDPIVTVVTDGDEDDDEEPKAIVIDGNVEEDEDGNPTVDLGENKVDIIEEDPTVEVVEIDDEEEETVDEVVTDSEDEVEVIEDTTPSYTELAREYVGGRLVIYTNDVADMEVVGDTLYKNYNLYY
jgi:hypothetical protein